MKSLIDILELSEQEIMELVNTACDIIDHPPNTRTSATAESSRPSSSSPPPAPV